MQTLSSFAQAIFPSASAAMGYPITRLLMSSDRLSSTEVETLMADTEHTLSVLGGGGALARSSTGLR